ncbi:MAG: hypothetical protein CMD39_01765 [Gammaproteobacteria bacterium]|nr:hypothetical protein [Gammaproteobacteria bacterium]
MPFHILWANRRTDVMLAGASGYIGRAVAAEFAGRGHHVTSVVRRGDPTVTRYLQRFGPVYELDVTDADSVAPLALKRPAVRVAVSCLASRSGEPADAWRVDYQANVNFLEAARAAGATRFVLLSAICVQNPRLEFQRAKLAFEAKLAASGLSYAIVRPTAYFKSLAGQIPRLRQGKPFVLFGDGPGPACLPISERDLASFIVDRSVDEERWNGIFPVGGPGPAVTPQARGEMLFRLLGRPARFRRLPLGIFDAVGAPLSWLGRGIPSLAAKAELARIGRFYATEPMLLKDPETGRYEAHRTPAHGEDTLEDFYRHVIAQGLGGQELGAQAIFSLPAGRRGSTGRPGRRPAARQ